METTTSTVTLACIMDINCCLGEYDHFRHITSYLCTYRYTWTNAMCSLCDCFCQSSLTSNAYCVLIYVFTHLDFTITSFPSHQTFKSKKKTSHATIKTWGKASWKLSESSEGYGIGLNSLAINLWLNGGPGKGKPMEIRQTIWWINSSRFFWEVVEYFCYCWLSKSHVCLMFFFSETSMGAFQDTNTLRRVESFCTECFLFTMSTEIPNVVQT